MCGPSGFETSRAGNAGLMDIAALTISLIAIGIAIVVAWREFGGSRGNRR